MKLVIKKEVLQKCAYLKSSAYYLETGLLSRKTYCAFITKTNQNILIRANGISVSESCEIRAYAA